MGHEWFRCLLLYMRHNEGFDKEGKEKEFEFIVQKNLRKEAFLRVYHSDKKGVK